MFCGRVRRAVLAASLLMVLAPAGIAQAQQERVSAEDESEILDLYARFAHAIDSGDGDAFAATWTEDGEFTGGRGPGRAEETRVPIRGTEALRAMGDSLGIGMRHVVSNIVIRRTEEGAEGHAYLLLLNSRSSPPIIIETAIYDDTLVKTEQGWRFSSRIVWRDDDDITPYKFKPLPANMPGPPN